MAPRKSPKKRARKPAPASHASPTITPPTQSDRDLLRRILNAGPDPDKHPLHKTHADERTAKPKHAD